MSLVVIYDSFISYSFHYPQVIIPNPFLIFPLRSHPGFPVLLEAILDSQSV